jgi:hypothetical protein
MTHYYYLEIEDWRGMYAEVAVEFDFFPGEETSRHDACPGSPAEVEITGATVIYLEGEGYRLHQRRDMGDWVKDLDRLALKYVDGLDLYEECVDCVCN